MTEPTLPQATREQEWPAVSAAYEFVRASHDWALQRIEAINSRLQSLLTFAATITLGAPVVAKALNDKPDFDSGPIHRSTNAISINCNSRSADSHLWSNCIDIS